MTGFVTGFMSLLFWTALPEAAKGDPLNRAREASVVVQATVDAAGVGIPVGSTIERAGILISREDGTGFVLTNAFLPRTTSVKCVFHRGEQNEFSVHAERFAIPASHFEMVKVVHDKLPEPLQLNPKTSISSGQPCSVIAFPDIERRPREPPAAVVRKCTISLAPQQGPETVPIMRLNSAPDELNPVIGGVVVNSDGDVLGWLPRGSVAPHLMVQSVKLMTDATEGVVDDVLISARRVAGTTLEVSVKCTLVDPLRQAKAVDLLVGCQAPSPERTGGSPPSQRQAGGAGEIVAMKINRNTAVGRIQLNRRAGFSNKTNYQIKYRSRSGAAKFTPIARLDLDILEADLQAQAAVRETVKPPRVESPPIDGEAQLIPLGGTLRAVLLAGGGRYLVLQFKDEGRAVIFDASTAKMAATLTVRDDAILAAGAEYAYAAEPLTGRIVRWPLDSPARETAGQLPLSGALLNISMGYASNGPILLHWAENASESGTVKVTFHDSSDYSQLPISRATTVDTNSRRDGRPSVSQVDALTLRHMLLLTSANGNLSLCVGQPTSNQSRIRSLTYVDGSLIDITATDAHSVNGVMPDGSGVCREDGLVSPGFRTLAHLRDAIPTTDPDLVLATIEGHMVVFSLSRSSAVAEIPPLPEMSTLHDSPLSPLLKWQRYLFIAQARLLITIPASDDRLVLRSIAMDIGAKPERPKPAPKPDAAPGTDSAWRTWTDATGQHRIDAVLVGMEGSDVVLKKRDGSLIRVPIERLGAEDQAFLTKQR